MHQMRLEPTIPVFARTKTDNALDRAATVIGKCSTLGLQKNFIYVKPLGSVYLIKDTYSLNEAS
jgi:hypothetical protein